MNHRINKMSLAFMGLFLLLPTNGQAEDLSPFTTDGCSAFPDGTIQQQSLWVSCCIRHDLAYWKGGSYEQRQEADRALQQCVAEIGMPGIASIMHMGVRVGGSPFFPTSYRWGYGWTYLRGYKPLSGEEKQQVRQRMNEFRELIIELTDKMDSRQADRP